MELNELSIIILFNIYRLIAVYFNFRGGKMYKYIVLWVALTNLAACSSKDLYQIGQEQQKSQCLENAQTPEAYHECLTVNRQSYEEYEKERQTVLKK